MGPQEVRASLVVRKQLLGRLIDVELRNIYEYCWLLCDARLES
jgi:hypothetical protein